MKQPQKSAIFIDGANVYSTVKSLGFEIDYKRLLNEFRSRGSLLRSFYYTAVFEDSERPSLQPLLDWLAYNGFTVVTKAGKEFIDQSGRPKIKSNVNVELAIDAMEIAPRIDQMVLFSGDGDLRSLVQAVQRRGVRVVVVSSTPTRRLRSYAVKQTSSSARGHAWGSRDSTWPIARLAHPHAHLGSCRFFSGSGANLQVLGGDEDLSFAHASPDTSVQRRGPL